MKLLVPLIMVIISSLLLVGCSGMEGEGILQGKVSIGPLSPVEQLGQITTIRCNAYDARKIMVYDESGEKLLKQVDIICDIEENTATYKIALEPGVYTVDINHIGIDRSGDIPKQIEITDGETVNLDIDIDTGIR
jgi:hypothetical protein